MREELSVLQDFCVAQGLPAGLAAAAGRASRHRLESAPHLLRDPTAHLPRATRSEVLDAAGRDALGGLFRAMSPDSRARLAEVLRPCAFAPGRVIFAALDVATEFYWVVKGEVEMVDVRGVVLGR